MNVMLMPFHKIISSIPHGRACVGADRRREHDALQRRFPPDAAVHRRGPRPLEGGDGIHTENIPGTDHAVRNKRNDYLIDRALQASGKSYTGMTRVRHAGLRHSGIDGADRRPHRRASARRATRRSSRSAACCCRRSRTMPPASRCRAWTPRATACAPAASKRRRASRSRTRWNATSDAIRRSRPNRAHARPHRFRRCSRIRRVACARANRGAEPTSTKARPSR